MTAVLTDETDQLQDDLARYRELVDAELEAFLPPVTERPETLHEAMRYSVFAGGKRMRPILTLLAAKAVGGDADRLVGPAAAVELLHTYTLIHDDLPCMDDDDLRRGRPSCHKAFGEAMALLAGDALQAAAFDMLLTRGSAAGVAPASLARVARELAQAGGSRGVVAGQVEDMAAEGGDIGLDQLQEIHRQKTGELFVYAARAGAIMAGASDAHLEAITGFGEFFGLLFQITDDILNVVGSQDKLGKPVGSDVKRKKATYPAMLGLNGSWRIAEQTGSDACECLADMPGDPTALYTLTALLLSREN